MRVAIVGAKGEDVSRIFVYVFQRAYPDWEIINLGHVPAQQFVEEIPSLTADCLVIADYNALVNGYLVRQKHNIPIIAVYSYYTPDSAYRVRCNSVYPLPAPCSMDDLLEIVETQYPILRDEIASSNRTELAQAAADKMVPAREA